MQSNNPYLNANYEGLQPRDAQPSRDVREPYYTYTYFPPPPEPGRAPAQFHASTSTTTYYPPPPERRRSQDTPPPLPLYQPRESLPPPPERRRSRTTPPPLPLYEPRANLPPPPERRRSQTTPPPLPLYQERESPQTTPPLPPHYQPRTEPKRPSPLPLHNAPHSTTSSLSAPFAISQSSPSHYRGTRSQSHSPQPSMTSFPPITPPYHTPTYSSGLPPNSPLPKPSPYIPANFARNRSTTDPAPPPPKYSVVISPSPPPSSNPLLTIPTPTSHISPPPSTSTFPTTTPLPSPSKLASLTPHSTSHLLFLSFPPSLHPLLRTSILSHWPRGIASESYTNDTHSGAAWDVKLKGAPWGEKEDMGVLGRRVVCGVIRTLGKEGWGVEGVTGDGGNEEDREDGGDEQGGGGFIFRYQGQGIKEGKSGDAGEVWALALVDTGTLRERERVVFVDAPDGVVGGIERGDLAGIVKGKAHRVKGCYEIRQRQSSEMGVMRGVVGDVLAGLEAEGWRVYAAGSGGKVGAETWYCCRGE
ncbi:hypothetical protein EJ04DRAFT_582282 [Polyplosphaeria fusca]|uniref:Uncharacterized protein n=1 Tax=Polyplosphaeria fusca TaxID=682080 RepID=A0A9P4UUE3_9PLEO|nr:hypothetical protein EJ04DRAFT_582282 [Polyplosphaeria fusca]